MTKGKNQDSDICLEFEKLVWSRTCGDTNLIKQEDNTSELKI